MPKIKTHTGAKKRFKLSQVREGHPGARLQNPYPEQKNDEAHEESQKDRCGR